MVETKDFLANPKPQYHVSQWREHDCSAHNKKNRDYYEYPRLFHSCVKVSCKENDGKKSFIANPKPQYHVSQYGEHDFSAHNKKRWRLLRVSKIVAFHGWALITRKFVARKAFLTNPKVLYLVSQCGKYNCSVNNKKNGDCYEYPSLPHFMGELWL